MSLMDQLTSVVTSQLVSGAAQKTGLSQDMAAKLMPMAITALMGGLKNNTSKPEGARALANALEKHDGSVLSQASRVAEDDSLLEDGQKILGHILGAKRGAAEQQLSQAAGGIDQAQVGKLLAMAAPLVLGGLGKAKREQNLDEAALAGLVREEGLRARKQAPNELGGLMSMLDADGDGQIDSNLTQGVAKGLGKRLLGSLFGRK